MNRVSIVFTDCVKKKMIWNLIPAMIIFLVWMYGIHVSVYEAVASAVIAVVVLTVGDMISSYFFGDTFNATNSNHPTH
ncbi:hypothetical protein QCD85_19030 [Paenibacillus sp. PsM32]|uniref:Uncharacterized protein n=1 Tax=Paenibacillus kyungheensis TaxID=1452732 RepID=A0AAX3M0V0_9BACL|nr:MULTISPECIES: hypothetical protein [Paenibacillus]MDN4620216.1 hypothetical protein [Paenibacillus sp. PsM32]MDQ1236039.1 hypothetical protein [Paenibacillus sp. SORGH_AS_0306]MDR6108396.1 hypothetical protein [Paenibacillus sp. SORGH_AS_0338]WCT55518.1 hypothetical protein PQ456_20595 [Paenibacillus kyungheensis]WDF51325.1 hypothetical protein PQ460_02370 [Paenibacillus sp. KACC 21273]